MIDIHTHLLPELDDGSRSVDETLQMLKVMWEQGVDTVVATPHFYIDRQSPAEFISERDAAVEKLKSRLSECENRPRIAVGAEVQFYPEIPDMEGIERLCLGGSRYLLVEMPFSQWSGYTYRSLSRLSSERRIVPVIAHIERYFDSKNDADKILRLKEAGALIQTNSSFIIERATRRKALNLLKKEEISFLGSDCHNLTTRPPDIGNGIEIAFGKLGGRMFEELEYWEEKLKEEMVVF